MELDLIPKKRGRKRNLVGSGGSVGDKMLLTLVAEVVAFHVSPTAVDIWGLGLELVSRSTFETWKNI